MLEIVYNRDFNQIQIQIFTPTLCLVLLWLAILNRCHVRPLIKIALLGFFSSGLCWVGSMPSGKVHNQSTEHKLFNLYRRESDQTLRTELFLGLNIDQDSAHHHLVKTFYYIFHFLFDISLKYTHISLGLDNWIKAEMMKVSISIFCIVV